MKYGSAICLGQEISSELLDQFGARILLILIQIYKSGVPNWLPSQNTSHPISHVSRQARVVSMADEMIPEMISQKTNTILKNTQLYQFVVAELKIYLLLDTIQFVEF